MIRVRYLTLHPRSERLWSDPPPNKLCSCVGLLLLLSRRIKGKIAIFLHLPASHQHWLTQGCLSNRNWINKSIPHPRHSLLAWDREQVSLAFPKFSLCHFAFRKRPTLVPDFTNRETWRGFLVLRKKKSENSIHASFAAGVHGGSPHSEPQVACPNSFPGNYTQHLHIKLPELWTMSVSLCARSFFLSFLFFWCIC